MAFLLFAFKLMIQTALADILTIHVFYNRKLWNYKHLSKQLFFEAVGKKLYIQYNRFNFAATFHRCLVGKALTFSLLFIVHLKTSFPFVWTLLARVLVAIFPIAIFLYTFLKNFFNRLAPGGNKKVTHT